MLVALRDKRVSVAGVATAGAVPLNLAVRLA